MISESRKVTAAGASSDISSPYALLNSLTLTGTHVCLMWVILVGPMKYSLKEFK